MRSHRHILATGLVAVLALGATGCGGDSHSSSGDHSTGRIVDIAMVDNAYQPSQVAVADGETITMRFRNDGTVTHEAVVGDESVQARHHDDMTASTGDVAHGDSGHGDDGPGAPLGSISVEAGQTGEITHTFDEAGSVLVGCHVPGHWEDGMKATIEVT